MLILFLLSLFAGHPRGLPPKIDAASQQPATDSTSTYVPPGKYDPSRNPEKDLAAASAEAKKSNRYIFVVVGGEWCIWCHIMDDFFHDHPNLQSVRGKNYVLMKLNMSRENENRAFWPGIPRFMATHIFSYWMRMGSWSNLRQRTNSRTAGAIMQNVFLSSSKNMRRRAERDRGPRIEFRAMRSTWL